jgi:hypothetical protein
MADVVDLAARRTLSAAEETAERAWFEIMRQISTAPDPEAAAFAVIYGAARFLLGRGVTPDFVAEVAEMIARHMAELE